MTPSTSDNAQPENQPAENTSSNWLTQPETLRELAFLTRDEKLTELEVSFGDTRLEFKAAKPKAPRVRKAKVAAEGEAETEAPEQETLADEAEVAESADASLATVVSPMVGIFYRAPSPSDPPFVEVGDTVEVGQTVGLVETMKVFNEITSEASGTVVEILKESAQLVETGEALITLKQ